MTRMNNISALPAAVHRRFDAAAVGRGPLDEVDEDEAWANLEAEVGHQQAQRVELLRDLKADAFY